MVLTTHVQERMQSRDICEEDVAMTVEYGRTIYARGAVFKVVGKKEIDRYRDEVDLEHLEGVHVVLAHDGTVITAYRNRQFRQTDIRKPRYRPHRHPDAGQLWLKRCAACGL